MGGEGATRGPHAPLRTIAHALHHILPPYDTHCLLTTLTAPPLTRTPRTHTWHVCPTHTMHTHGMYAPRLCVVTACMLIPPLDPPTLSPGSYLVIVSNVCLLLPPPSLPHMLAHAAVASCPAYAPGSGAP